MTHEHRMILKRERQQAAADRLRGQAQADYHKADLREEASGISLGQPILVGHHSEARHRRALDRANNAMRRAVDADSQADELERRANLPIDAAGISSDDEDAVEKLENELASKEAKHAAMKAVNKAWRDAGKPTPDNADGWAKVGAALSGVDISTIRINMAHDFIDRAPYTFQLTNNSGNMKRIRERIASLKASASSEPAETECEGFTITESPDDNRIQISFPDKPDSGIRAILKHQGFRWSPTLGVWQRMLNNAGRAAAQYVAQQINRTA